MNWYYVQWDNGKGVDVQSGSYAENTLSQLYNYLPGNYELISSEISSKHPASKGISTVNTRR